MEKLGRNAGIDFLVEDGTDNLLSVCGEAKYFRYSIEGVSHGRRTVFEVIDDDFEKLKLLNKHEIGRDSV
jgi:hypothetical protein